MAGPVRRRRQYHAIARVDDLPHRTPASRSGSCRLTSTRKGAVMGYARHIGRVGALAVTLGVGAAIANAPGIANAETPGTSPGGDPTQKTTSSPTDTSTNQTSPRTGAADDADDTQPSAADRRSQRRSVVRAVVGALRDIADGAVAAGGNSAGAISKPEKPGSPGDNSVERKTASTSPNTTRVRARVT